MNKNVSSFLKIFSLVVVLCLIMAGGYFIKSVQVEIPGPLSKVHADLEDEDSCAACHDLDSFSVEPSRCFECHDVLKVRIDQKKGYHADKYQNCEKCHQEHRGRDAKLIEFNLKKFNHSETGYPLRGIHAEFSDCMDCHEEDSFLTLSGGCTVCHDDEHKDPQRQDCILCHIQENWIVNPQRLHSSGWTLSGKHRTVPCAECHISPSFQSEPRECSVCHWQRRQDDPYRLRLGAECGECHTPLGWWPVNWSHDKNAGYVLKGSHRLQNCDACHTNLRFQGTSSECYFCHSDDYREADDPDHQNAGFPLDCEICHTEDSFEGADFDHTSTGFVLSGAHRGALCSECHKGGVFQGTSSDCVSCHLDDYNSVRDPDHRSLGFPYDCALCHDTNSFEGAEFDHASTGFILDGAHRGKNCSECHIGGNTGLSSECYACHRPDYESARDPDHKKLGFPLDCSLCHDTKTFEGAEFDHASTGFVLSGAHRSADCSACHIGGNTGLSSECYACHKEDYESVKDPDHAASGFSTDCALCHNTTSFEGADFNHNSTGYILQGVHRTLDCTACHVSGQYAGTPDECYACHQDDYERARDPNHIAAGFPQDCSLCHKASDLSFDQGTFDHGVFIIETGKHRRFSCSDCHPQADNFAVYTCTSCHLKSVTDEDHSGVDGYVYKDQNCLGCHPDGRE